MVDEVAYWRSIELAQYRVMVDIAEEVVGEPTDATVSRRVDAILRAIGVKARGRW